MSNYVGAVEGPLHIPSHPNDALPMLRQVEGAALPLTLNADQLRELLGREKGRRGQVRNNLRLALQFSRRAKPGETTLFLDNLYASLGCSPDPSVAPTVWQGWLDELAEYPVDIVRAACRDWLRGYHSRPPTYGELVDIANRYLTQRYAGLQRLETAVSIADELDDADKDKEAEAGEKGEGDASETEADTETEPDQGEDPLDIKPGGTD